MIRSIIDALIRRQALLSEIDQLRERVEQLEKVSREHEALRRVVAGRLLTRVEVRA